MAVHAGGQQAQGIGSVDEIMRSVSLVAPEDGVVIVNSAAALNESTSGGFL